MSVLLNSLLQARGPEFDSVLCISISFPLLDAPSQMRPRRPGPQDDCHYYADEGDLVLSPCLFLHVNSLDLTMCEQLEKHAFICLLSCCSPPTPRHLLIFFSSPPRLPLLPPPPPTPPLHLVKHCFKIPCSLESCC